MNASRRVCVQNGGQGGPGGGMGGMGGGQNPMAFGKSKAKFQMEPNTGVKFDDVAGVEEAKQDFMEVRPLSFSLVPGKPHTLLLFRSPSHSPPRHGFRR
jgi:cell division protease FtsH